MSQQTGGQMLPRGGDTGAGMPPRASCFQHPYEAGPIPVGEEGLLPSWRAPQDPSGWFMLGHRAPEQLVEDATRFANPGALGLGWGLPGAFPAWLQMGMAMCPPTSPSQPCLAEVARQMGHLLLAGTGVVSRSLGERL